MVEAERDSSSLGNALVDAVERRFSAEIDGIGAIQEGLSESAIKLEFCPFDWEPPVTRELADMPKGVVRLALPEGDVPVPRKALVQNTAQKRDLVDLLAEWPSGLGGCSLRQPLAGAGADE